MPGPSSKRLRRIWQSLVFTAALFTSFTLCHGRQIHVSKQGSDTNPGTRRRPLLTISKAAELAMPGDVVIVHAGTYREWVRPARGGTGEGKRIIYRAAPGEKVVIKGSERITSWRREGNGVWRVSLPNSFFGRYNPYALKLSGGWLHYGLWHHRGDVYLDGEALLEKRTLEEVSAQKGTWCCRVENGMTTIWANFGAVDPNRSLTEINVRQAVFMPEKSGLGYITVDGFTLMHSAENWEPPGLLLQMGLIGPRMGKCWVIENCTIVNARCVGIILGHAPGVDYRDIEAFGGHIVQNNIIRRCGEAGIAGQKGATRSIIRNNLIEDTNYRREFGGWETAAIKFHESVDVLIEGNLIRRVGRQGYGAFGIWLDWANQGARVRGNVIYQTDTAAIFLEMNHGPTLVDNNIVIGKGIRSNSEASTFAHNLFVDCDFAMVSDTKRSSQYYKPHTCLIVGRRKGIPRDDKWFNNIFVRRGLDRVRPAPGYASDWNIFYEGAKRSRFGDLHSIEAPFVTGFDLKEEKYGVVITFRVDRAPFELNPPWVDSGLVGKAATVGQTIESPGGLPIRVDKDFGGKPFKRPLPGPLSDLAEGCNRVTWHPAGH